MSENKEREKAIILKTVHLIIETLNICFPWKVIEIAVSFQLRIGKESSFVKSAFEGIIDTISEKEIEEYVVECPESDMLSPQAGISLFEKNSNGNMPNLLKNFSFNFDGVAPEECEAWDKAEEVSPHNSQDKKIVSIQNIKVNLRELAMLKSLISHNQENYSEEIIAINTIFEILDFNN